MGTFILVGKGTLQVEDMTRILEARNRSAAGATAPASGLYLVGCGVLRIRRRSGQSMERLREPSYGIGFLYGD